jgi:hypothetical protein
MKKSLIIGALVAAATSTSAAVSAQELSIKITNLTNGIYFTPLLVAAHNGSVDLFEPGMAASMHLQMMAEGGNLAGLVSDVANAGADYVANPASGLLAPGATTTAMISTMGHKNDRLSIAAMLLPTNDGFVGADSFAIPKQPGTYTYYLNGYDAGTEANDEIINGAGAPGMPGIPGAPGGTGGMGATGVTTMEFNHTVHIHPGIVGDMNPAGGISDLNPAVHHWLNPVAKVEIVVGKTIKGSGHNDD